MDIEKLKDTKINFLDVNTVYQDDEDTIQDLICKYDSDLKNIKEEFEDIKEEFKDVQETKVSLENGLNNLEEWDKVFEETSNKIEEKYSERLNSIEVSLDNKVHKIHNTESIFASSEGLFVNKNASIKKNK